MLMGVRGGIDRVERKFDAARYIAGQRGQHSGESGIVARRRHGKATRALARDALAMDVFDVRGQRLRARERRFASPLPVANVMPSMSATSAASNAPNKPWNCDSDPPTAC